MSEQRKFGQLLAEAAGHRKSRQALAGSLMGRSDSAARTAIARAKGRLGGRPRKHVGGYALGLLKLKPARSLTGGFFFLVEEFFFSFVQHVGDFGTAADVQGLGVS